MTHLVCFGLGYSARVFGRALLEKDWKVFGTTRDPDSAAKLMQEGFNAALFSGENGVENSAWGLVISVVAGLVVGWLIGQVSCCKKLLPDSYIRERNGAVINKYYLHEQPHDN